MQRPDYLKIDNGDRQTLPFSNGEYERRLCLLRDHMAREGLDAVWFTSMHNVAYYSGFLYCAFGRPYGLAVTQDQSVTVSANIDYGQPQRRSHGENLVYTDWRHDNYLRAIASIIGQGKRVGVEFDHLNITLMEKGREALDVKGFADIAPAAMAMRMKKSFEEIALIREGARIADIGGFAMRDAIRPGVSELDIAVIGREAMEREIARCFPLSEIRDSWVWFQSGLNTDGAHNPVTTRILERGDILSLNAFPMISSYYTALERTLFLGNPDARSLQIWEANVVVHKRGLDLIRPGARCCDIVSELNALYAEYGLLDYRTFGYGHSFGILSHYYGREAGLELREDVETVIEPGMVISMEPMVTVPEEQAGAGGYREHDILVVEENGADNITGFGFGPEHNIIAA